MNAFSRIIESLQVKYHVVALRQIINPLQLSGYLGEKNLIVYLNKGDMAVGSEFAPIREGQFFFVPYGQPIFIRHTKAPQYKVVGTEGFPTHEEWQRYVKYLDIHDDISNQNESFIVFWFDVLLYHTISLFSILELPSFALPQNEEMYRILNKIVDEEKNSRTGKSKLLNVLTEELVIHICRYIETQPALAGFIDKASYLLDKRLVNIVQFIHDNLDKNLSNKAIASVAFVSEDYVGQFFKSLTNKNLQEYVENQRLERAYHLLQTRNDSIQEIAHQVGFKDPAYFSRRFKIKFGENANAVRKKVKYLM